MGRIDLENFPTSSSALRMLDDVSTGFYENSYVGKWLYQVMGLEYDDAFQLAEELPVQFFPETATWGLKYHEMKWQLPIRENLGYEERRRLIYRKRDYRAPMTPYRMETIVRNVTGLDVYIADCHDPGKFGFSPEHPNIFRVDIEGGATLDVLIKALKLLNEIKQSHTIYGIYHSLAGGTADVKTLAGGGIGNTLKVKARTVDDIGVKETLHIMTDVAVEGALKVKAKTKEKIASKESLRVLTVGVVGATLKAKPALQKQIQAHEIENVSAGILEANILKVKAKLPGKLSGGAVVQSAAHQKTGNRLTVKRGI